MIKTQERIVNVSRDNTNQMVAYLDIASTSKITTYQHT